MAEPTRPAISRRAFLGGAAGAGAIAVASGVGGFALADAIGATGGRPAPGRSSGPAAGLVPFEGRHQAGIVRPSPPQAAALFASFDVVSRDRPELASAMGVLSQRSRDLASGWSPDAGDRLYPPPESGVLGASTGPAGLTVTVGVGASLFDQRFGMADRRPRQLASMPTFLGDVIDPAISHGDLLVQVCAVDRLSCIHALRYLQAGTRDAFRLRWMIEGFTRPDPVTVPGHTTSRNLLGFKDGTANPATDDEALMDDLVWVGNGDGEPAWAAGGSYMVVRIIRMFVERWDRTALSEQEAIIGRTKRTGAPLGMAREEDVPDLAGDPDGARVALDAHIRLANPRTPGTERNRILRRGYSYSRGFDDAGLLDQGLVFVCFQRDLEAGFTTIQNRLAGEPLGEYIRAVGGGFFYALPGVEGASSSLGQSLLA